MTEIPWGSSRHMTFGVKIDLYRCGNTVLMMSDGCVNTSIKTFDPWVII